MTINWDYRLAPKAVAFNLRGQSISGPPSLSGRSQIWGYDEGFWEARLVGVNAAGPERVNAYRAMVAKCAGGSVAVRVPVFDLDQAPWPLPGGAAANLIEDGEFDDGTLFDDGTGFFEYAIEVEMAAPAEAGASQIHVTVTTAGTISEGMFFSIDDRLHRIREKLSDTSWLIVPKLREDVAQGTLLNFDRPVCRMRLANENSADLTLDFGRNGFPDMHFIEQF